MPLELRHGLRIQQVNHDALALLSKLAEHPHGIPAGEACFDLIWNCEKKFDRLFKELGAELSLTNKLAMQSARLHIQCTYFLYDECNAQCLPGLLRANLGASDIVNTILADETAHDILPYILGSESLNKGKGLNGAD